MCSIVFNKKLENDLCRYEKHFKDLNVRFERMILYQQTFKLFSLDEFTKKYLSRWFCVFVETKCFLELGYALVSELLSSSNLFITSEIEVFDAANAWIRHDIKNRRKYAKSLLWQVRFPLLSDCALKYILNKKSSFKQFEECRTVINNILCSGKSVVQKSRSNLENRYCTKPISMSSKLLNYRSVCYKGEVYTFNSLDHATTDSVEKYCPASNQCEKVAGLNEDWETHCYFSVCVLMGKIFMFGGNQLNDEGTTDICFEFDPKSCEWREMNRMGLAREGASPVVFSGRIVVSGGRVHWDDIDEDVDGGDENDDFQGDHLTVTRTVEEYDSVSNSWSEFPSMIKGRNFHQSVAVRNKLFVFGGGINESEVYDSTCKIFVRLQMNLPIKYKFLNFLREPSAAFTIDDKVLIFGQVDSLVLCYDVEVNEWSVKPYEIANSLEEFSSIQVSQLEL